LLRIHDDDQIELLSQRSIELGWLMRGEVHAVYGGRVNRLHGTTAVPGWRDASRFDTALGHAHLFSQAPSEQRGKRTPTDVALADEENGFHVLGQLRIGEVDSAQQPQRITQAGHDRFGNKRAQWHH